MIISSHSAKQFPVQVQPFPFQSKTTYSLDCELSFEKHLPFPKILLSLSAVLIPKSSF